MARYSSKLSLQPQLLSVLLLSVLLLPLTNDWILG
jgi:hypothetical protein